MSATALMPDVAVSFGMLAVSSESSIITESIISELKEDQEQGVGPSNSQQ